METKRRHRGLAACLALVALPVIAVAAAPSSLADDCDFDFASLNCMMNSDDGWTEPGNLVIPATGGAPEVAAAPAPPGAPVVTADGGLVIPAGPPIG